MPLSILLSFVYTGERTRTSMVSHSIPNTIFLIPCLMKEKVLLVDFDPQSNLSMYFGIEQRDQLP